MWKAMVDACLLPPKLLKPADTSATALLDHCVHLAWYLPQVVPVTVELNAEELHFEYSLDDWEQFLDKVGQGAREASRVLNTPILQARRHAIPGCGLHWIC
jgi:hypothetical protein